MDTLHLLVSGYSYFWPGRAFFIFCGQYGIATKQFRSNLGNGNADEGLGQVSGERCSRIYKKFRYSPPNKEPLAVRYGFEDCFEGTLFDSVRLPV